MDLENRTPFSARLVRIDRTEEQVDAVVIVKSTFANDAHGRPVPSSEQVPIIPDRLETPFGVFHTDCFVRKEGVDVCVLGTVRPGKPTRMARLNLSVDSHQSELSVFGERSWIRSRGGLHASDPIAFDEMPLAYSRAYGGVTEHDHESVTWPDNPVGRGYYLSAEKADGQPLPNIELAQGPPIRSWSDQPQVAGWAPYPLFWGMRAREGVEVRDPNDNFGYRIKARLNNHAHPSLVIPALHPDAVIRIRGMRETDLAVPIPRVAPVVDADAGGRAVRAGGALDGVFIWADAGRVTLTHRIHFSYQYRKGERRCARLSDAAATGRA